MEYIFKKQLPLYFFFLFIAIPLATHAQQKKPDELIKLAIEQTERGENDSAIVNFNSALVMGSNSAIAYYSRGRAYYRKGSYDQALVDYNKAIGLDPKYALAYSNRGLVYYRKANYDLAMADYNKAIELDPKYTLAYNNRGIAYNRKGSYDLALADYNKTIALDPKYAPAYNNRGLVYYNQGSRDLAMADYNKAIQLDPKYTIAYYDRGSAYYIKGSYALAMADYNKAIQLDPKYALAYNNRGLVYYQKGNYELAMSDYNKSIALNPKYALAYNNRGVAYYQKGLYDNAIADYKTCLQFAPLNEYALLNILPCLIRLNRFNEAGTYYKKYNSNNVQGYIESSGWEFYKLYLNAAIQYLSSSKYDDALTTLKTAEAKYNSNTQNNKDANAFAKSSYADVLALKGYILLKLNRLEDAKDAYNQALVINLNQPDVQAVLKGNPLKKLDHIEDTKNTNIQAIVVKPKLPDAKTTLKNDTLAKPNLAENTKNTNQQAIAIKPEKPVKRSISRNIESNNSPLDLPILKNGSSAPKYYAILIAEEKYNDNTIQTLQKPKADALQLKHLLETKYIFQPNNIDTLFNRRREDILSAISNKCNTLTENDNLLIFYSGHGAAKKDQFNNVVGYLVPSSAEKDNWFTYISTSDLVLALGGKGATKHILFIVDACFGGSLMKELTDAKRNIQLAYNNPSRHMMTSGNETPVPDNSIFLHYFIKKLEDNRGKYITGNDLFTSFRSAVINNSDNLPQYVVIRNTGDEGGDFVFIKK